MLVARSRFEHIISKPQNQTWPPEDMITAHEPRTPATSIVARSPGAWRTITGFSAVPLRRHRYGPSVLATYVPPCSQITLPG